jgi:hypothetical protein
VNAGRSYIAGREWRRHPWGSWPDPARRIGKPDTFFIDIFDSKGNDVYLDSGASPPKTGSITVA